MNRDSLVLLFTTVLVCAVGFTESFEVDIKCIPLPDCPDLHKLAENDPKSAVLKTAYCGYDGTYPKVWCPIIDDSKCETPEGELGKCVPVKKCQPFLTEVKKFVGIELRARSKYFQTFQCGEPNPDGGISVCCVEKLSVVPDLPKEPDNIKPNITKPKNSLKVPSFWPKADECGRQGVNKITGGKITQIDEFPWTAVLQYQSGPNYSTACAGTLISDKYVVTAAHCTEYYAIRRSGQLVNVILGEFDKGNDISVQDCVTLTKGFKDCADLPVKVPVEKIIIHPQWYNKPQGELNHDIALIRLSETVAFTDFIKPICLPPPKMVIKERQDLWVAGWGATDTSDSSSIKLKTNIPMSNWNLCVQKYRSTRKLTIGDGTICAGGEKGKDSCSGDSGGPLMYALSEGGTDGIWFLVGIVSFGVNNPTCGAPGYPGLYTYLPKYTDWIYETVKL